MRRFACLLGLGAVLLAPVDASATYSIVATDSATRQVGGSGASCVGSLSVTIILGLAPNVGAIHAQAQINQQGRNQGVTMLMQGSSPEEIITHITASSFDTMASRRQYGVVDLMGRSAGFTGSQNGNYANDRQGTDGPFTYSVQGNILTSDKVLENSEEGFLAGCDLPDRLMIALERGALDGEGDSRCTPRGVAADSAFIRVVDADGENVVFFDVTNTGSSDPLAMLRAEYDVWRTSNPCPDGGDTTGDDDGTGGADDDTSGDDDGTGGASDGDSGGATNGSTASSGDSGSAGTNAEGDGSGAGTYDDGGTDGDDAGSGDGGDMEGDEAGCGCSTGPSGSGAVLLLPLIALRRRRR